MHGRLFLIVGNSGAGKDSLISFLQRDAGERLNLAFPRRSITREQPDAHEAYRPLRVNEFAQRVKDGQFALWWEAYGYLYGIGSEVGDLLAAGTNVVLNVSREIVGEVRRRYPEAVVILVDAPREVISQRLTARARGGDQSEADRRLHRADVFRTFSDWDRAIMNDESLSTGGERLVGLLAGILARRPVLEITVLGSAGACPGPDNHCSSFILHHAEGNFLLDAPPDLIQLMAAGGFDLGTIRGMVITHDHPDHLLGLGALLHSQAGRDLDIPLFAPEETLETISAYLTALRLGGKLPRVSLRPVPLTNNANVCDLPGLAVRACPAAHSRPTIAVAFADKASGESAVFTSDTRPSLQLAAFAAGAGLLFHDCAGVDRCRAQFDRNHSSSLEAGKMACLAGVDRLVLTHLDHRCFISEEELTWEAKSEYAGPVSVARSGQVYALYADGSPTRGE